MQRNRVACWQRIVAATAESIESRPDQSGLWPYSEGSQWNSEVPTPQGRQEFCNYRTFVYLAFRIRPNRVAPFYPLTSPFLRNTRKNRYVMNKAVCCFRTAALKSVSAIRVKPEPADHTKAKTPKMVRLCRSKTGHVDVRRGRFVKEEEKGDYFILYQIILLRANEIYPARVTRKEYWTRSISVSGKIYGSNDSRLSLQVVLV